MNMEKIKWQIKEYIKSEGVECHSPRECLKEAFQLKLIDNDERWMQMVLDRNISVHLYKEQSADEIYAKLPAYAEMLKGLLAKLSVDNLLAKTVRGGYDI